MRSRGCAIRRAAFALALCFAAGGLRAQFGFEETFDEDPFASGEWVRNSNWRGPAWVPPGAPQCANPNVFDPSMPCTVDERYGGYVLITDPVGLRGANIFRSRPELFESFKLTVEVELRDGSIGRPADGMVVVVVGGDRPPGRLGTLGGGMGAPCVGGERGRPEDDFLPMLMWEFDNWSANAHDGGPGVSGDAGGFPDSVWHHVAFAYSPDGFPCTDAIIPQVFFPFRTSETPLHNYQPPPADPNRFRMTVHAQRCGSRLIVACDLEAVDLGVDRGRIYTHVIPDYEPFYGYFGVTASTGGAWQNHILHSARLEELPPGLCFQPAAEATRSITPENPHSCGDWGPRSLAHVSLTLSRIREASDCCPEATRGRVVERVPEGWEVSAVSDGGTHAGGTITWDLSGAAFTAGKVLTYTAVAPPGAPGAATFSGNKIDDLGGIGVFTPLDSSLRPPPAPFDSCGRLRCWNLLGALEQPGGAAPGADALRRDYLSDGLQGELDFVFEPGAEVAPDFSGAAASTGVFIDPFRRNPDAAAGVATVFKHLSPDGLVDFKNAVFRGGPADVMAYAQVYVISDAEREVFIACDSGSSIQIILNEEEVWLHSVERRNDAACPLPRLFPETRLRLRDVTPAPVRLLEGENRLIVKTFAGRGDFNFELRFEEADGSERPVTEGLSLRLTPSPSSCRRPPAVATRAIATGREVNGRPVWSSAEGAGAFPVTLRLSSPEGAGGICPTRGGVTIVDTVPAGWTPSDPSRGGAVRGREVSWTVPAGEEALLSYTVSPGGAGDGVFSGVLMEAGSPVRHVVRGQKIVRHAPRLLGRGRAAELIADDFDAGAGGCPPGWTCSAGAGAFVPHVNPEGRLQLACATSQAACGNGAASAIWNEPLDLTARSFSARFDLYFSFHGAVLGGNPPGDGFAFVVLDADHPATGTPPPAFVGRLGGCNGYCGLSGFAVEFDFGRDGPADPSGYDSDDAPYTHVAIIRDGEVLPHVQIHQEVLGADAFPTFLGGSGWPEFIDFSGSGYGIRCEVEYDNGHLRVFIEAPETTGRFRQVEPAFPRTKVLDAILTFPAGGGFPESVLRKAWLGFTAGTSAGLVNAAIDDFAVTVYEPLPRPLEPVFLRGDANADGALDLSDAVFIFHWLFLGGPEPPCLEAANAADAAAIDISTGIFLLGYLFLGGPPPPPPGPPAPGAACGPDPMGSASSLGCERYSGC
jgi:hypothetical protein